MFRSLLKPKLTSSLECFVVNFLSRISKGIQCHRCPPEVTDYCCLTGEKKVKVTLCGASGHVGQIIAFLLKQSPLINTLALYDVDNPTGVAMDVSHIDTRCRVQAYTGCYELTDALINSDVVIICAGVGRAPGMSIDELFEYNAPVVKQIAETCIQACPTALIGVLTNPINSLVPMIAQIYKLCNCFDPNRIFGITAIDTMRACSIVTSDVLQGHGDPGEFLVPVIGGHSPKSMVPVLSQTTPCIEIPHYMIEPLIEKIRTAASAVLSEKNFKGGPRLSVALGAARFTNNLIKGLKDEEDIIEMTYTASCLLPGVSFFASPVQLGPCGIKCHLGMIRVDEVFEKPFLRQAIQHLRCDIQRGEEYICPPSACCNPSC